MMRRLLIFILAADYFIGAYAYTIDGAAVRSTVYCQQDRRISIYRLTATDTAAHRYWLMYRASEIDQVSVAHTGLVEIEGTDMIWRAHDVGDTAQVVTSIPGCWPRDEDLQSRYHLALPLVLK